MTVKWQYNEIKNKNSKQNNYTAVKITLNAYTSSEINIDAPIQYTLQDRQDQRSLKHFL